MGMAKLKFSQSVTGYNRMSAHEKLFLFQIQVCQCHTVIYLFFWFSIWTRVAITIMARQISQIDKLVLTHTCSFPVFELGICTQIVLKTLVTHSKLFRIANWWWHSFWQFRFKMAFSSPRWILDYPHFQHFPQTYVLLSTLPHRLVEYDHPRKCMERFAASICIRWPVMPSTV